MNIKSTSLRSKAANPSNDLIDDSAIVDSFAADRFADEPDSFLANGSPEFLDLQTLTQLLLRELRSEVKASANDVETLATRIATEVDRICHKSGRIQTSGKVRSWQLSLARHRLQKCLTYYQLGSRRGRLELHSTLGSMVYRYVAPTWMQLGFQARYSLIEDFLQGFYSESLKAFRRENELSDGYQPRTRLELAEYMAFTEQYAKRRISLPNGQNQQLIVLRAQRFGKRQPLEVSVDIEQALESPKSEEAETHNRSPLAQQLREQMVMDAIDAPSEAVLRDRVIAELISYLSAQGQSDCVDYLVLKLQDLSAPEIDEILGLTARQRDYLQQRFKYHVEKFTLSQNWKLVHQWLGADLDQNLGLSTQQWQIFMERLSPEQQRLLALKQAHTTEQEIAQALKCTPKQLQKRWGAGSRTGTPDAKPKLKNVSFL
ncbi:HetZ-related protein [Leptothermofonsia sp. ETS-13]|uniref:HetZ-related protein n=1 Tax=Leptothermofonsia sp. ETS-13 TaxID=3035696 RepID=UPI003B9F5E2F